MRSLPAGLALAIALIQLAHLAYFAPFVGTYGDTAGYVDLANVIFSWPLVATYYQPLYPAVLRIAGLLAGHENVARFMVLAQIGMVMATALMIYGIALRLTGRRVLAVAAALLVALDVRITIFEYLLLTEIVSIFLSVSMMYALTRALLDDSRLAAGLASLAMLALALTKVSYFLLPFVAAVAFGALAWRFRTSRRAAALRRCAVGIVVVALLVVAKIVVSYSYTGMVSANSGDVLRHFLSRNPELVLGLPDGDPSLAKFKQSYAQHGSFLFAAEHFGGNGPAAARATIRIYARAILHHPGGAFKASLKEYYRQTSRNDLFIYPEETNFLVFASSPNWLFAVERAINAAIFGSWPSVIWNSLCLLLAVAFLLPPLPASQKIVLAVLLGFILYTIGVTTWTFAGIWIGDNSRMRLLYEAPLIVLWFFVPYRMFGLPWRGTGMRVPLPSTP